MAVEDHTEKDIPATVDADGNPVVKPAENTPEEQAKDTLKSFLTENDISSQEELQEALKASAKLRKEYGELDIAALKKSHETLQAYEAKWAEEERKKLKDSEDPEDTITRLEKENNALRKQEKEKEGKAELQKKAAKVIKEFHGQIDSLVNKSDQVADYLKPFAKTFLGMENPSNMINISDADAVVKMVKTNLPILAKFEQAVIKAYTDGKAKVTPISKSAPAAEERKKPRSIAQAGEFAKNM